MTCECKETNGERIGNPCNGCLYDFILELKDQCDERLAYERRILRAEVAGVRAEKEMRAACELAAGRTLNVPLKLGTETDDASRN